MGEAPSQTHKAFDAAIPLESGVSSVPVSLLDLSAAHVQKHCSFTTTHEQMFKTMMCCSKISDKLKMTLCRVCLDVILMKDNINLSYKILLHDGNTSLQLFGI